MSGFSDDGQWWWDGSAWVATPQVVIPDLPATEFEMSEAGQRARNRSKTQASIGDAIAVEGLALGGSGILMLMTIPLHIMGRRQARDYRLWTLEQLAAATTFLLGSNEPMVAGESTVLPSFLANGVQARDQAVVVTDRHVLVLRFDSTEGQPRWVGLAARAADVHIELRSGIWGSQPTLLVQRGNAIWPIRGYKPVFQPEPVLNAWHKAAFAETGSQVTGQQPA